jgi:hypothetical protein
MVTVATSGPEDNWVRSGIDTGSVAYNPITDETTVALHKNLADCWEEGKKYHFVGGEFHAGMSYDPLETFSNPGWPGHDVIKVSGEVVIGWPTPYWLKDDDNPTLLPELPSMAKLNSIFDDCYITCDDNASGGASNVAFERNVGDTTTEATDLQAAADRGSGAEEGSGWWVVYVLSGYQPCYTKDWDPDSDGGGVGATGKDDYQVSVIFRENVRDGALHTGVNAATLEAQTVVHEIGHQVLEEGESAHTPNTIMSALLPVDPGDEEFSAAHIRKIREQTTSPGT